MSLLFGGNRERNGNRQSRSGIEAFRHGKSSPCPSCGATIGLKEQHSFRAILTDSVRTHLNGLLVDARNFTRGLDSFLARLSHRLELCDPYGTPYVREELNHLIDAGLIERATWLDLTADTTGDPDSEAAQQRRQRTADDDEGREDPEIEEAGTPTIQSSLRNTVYQQLEDGNAVSVVRECQDVYGVLSTETEAGRWAEYFQLLLDTHDFDNNFATFPLLDSAEIDDAEKCRWYARLLLGPALERRGNALLLNLVEEQPAILAYRQSGKLTEHRDAVNRLVAQLRPELGRYYGFIESHLDKLDDSEAAAVRKNLERAQFLLLILHGHGWRMLPQEVRTQFETEFGDDFEEFGCLFLRDLYALSDQTEITGELLSKMVAARTILQIENRSLVERLPEWVRELYRKVTSRLYRRSPDRNWLQHIGDLVVIQCANQIEADRTILVPGDATSSHSDSDQTDTDGAPGAVRSGIDSLARFFPWMRRPDHMREETVRVFVPCSYALSECPTYSIVLLGSPGTGKTTAFEAGLAKLWRVAEELGLELMPVDPESTTLIERIQNQFFAGQIQKPTEVNLALNFEARLIREPEKRVRVSVIDVPGEKVNALASGKGADSELRRILRHANTIVFQFDLWSDKTLWRQLAARGASEFESQLELAATLEASRRQKEGYFSDQSLLLSRLISMLESERPRAELEELNFVCLFPKIDTLTANNGQTAPHLIFSDLMKTLQTQELLVPARSTPGNGQGRGSADSNSSDRSRAIAGLGDLESLAGLGLADDSPLIFGPAENEETGANDENGSANTSEFSRQVAICRTLSESTKKSLDRLGDMLPSETPGASKAAFSGRIRNGVIGKVETHFRSSFFLPVSALGRTPTPEENQLRCVTRPNSVLVEYAFLLPLMAAFEDSYGDSGT